MPKTQQQTVQDKRSDWPMLGTFFHRFLFFVFMQVLLKCTEQGKSSVISSEGNVSKSIQKMLFDWLLPHNAAEVYF